MNDRVPLASLGDLEALDIDAALARSTRPLVSDFGQVFQARARETAEGGGNQTPWQFLELLCSFHLQPDSLEAPIVSSGQLGEIRFFGPEDLLGEEIETARGWLSAVRDPELQARVGEVSLLRGGRHHQRVATVVEAYVRSAERLHGGPLWPEQVNRLERALRLAMAFGVKQPAYSRALDEIYRVMDAFSFGPNPWLPLRLSRLLAELRIGDVAREASRCRALIETAKAEGNERAVQEYSQLLARWEHRRGDAEAVRNAHLESARSHERLSAQLLDSNPMAAEHELSRAIEAARSAGDSRDFADALQGKLDDAQQRVLGTLKEHSASVELTRSANLAREAVRGHDLLDALARLAFICNPTPITDLEAAVEERSRQSFMLHIVEHSVLSRRGRTVARIPPLLGASDEDRKTALRMHAMQRATYEQELRAMGIINPARLEILAEHGPGITVADLVPVLQHNPFVPSDRVPAFAMGLWFGLVGDFGVAAHVLVPQLEHAIRLLLEQQGVLVYSHDSQGIQREDDLGKLLDKPEAVALFGADLHFDLIGLLVRPAGANLRNRIAHGLIPAAEFGGPIFVYLWWMTLRLCFEPLVRVVSPEAESVE